MQQLILNAQIDIIYHLRYLYYFEFQYLLTISHGYLIMCILHEKINIKKIDLYAMLQATCTQKIVQQCREQHHLIYN